MVALNAVFAAYEMALASVSRSKLLYLVEVKKKGATEALFMKDRMEASLAGVQLGVTLVASIAAAVGGAGTTEALKPYFESLGLSKALAQFLSLACLVIPLSSFTLIFAELIPKTYAIKNNEQVILRLSKLMLYFTYIAYPAVALLENTVKAAMRFIDSRRPAGHGVPDAQSSMHELTSALSMVRASRLINAQQEKIVLSAAQLSLRPIKDIMIPTADICMIPQNSSLSDALVRAHLDMHTRFPVCVDTNDPQTIVGYINFKDIIAALKINPDDPTIKGTIRPIKKFPETMPISRVLERMISEKLHIGLVENAQQKTTGMVTQEDIIEELVGEIEDEFDRLPTHIHPYGNQWLVGGAVPMSALARAIGTEWKEDDLRLADWCQRQFNKPFHGGEIIPGHGFQVTVRKLKRKKISEALVSRL
jgi:putative hemolysin